MGWDGGQNTTCRFLGYTPFSSYKTILKSSTVENLSAFDWPVSLWWFVFGRMLAWLSSHFSLFKCCSVKRGVTQKFACYFVKIAFIWTFCAFGSYFSWFDFFLTTCKCRGGWGGSGGIDCQCCGCLKLPPFSYLLSPVLVSLSAMC